MKYENGRDIFPEELLKRIQKYAAAGKLEEWVHTYLLSDGHNEEFLERYSKFFEEC